MAAVAAASTSFAQVTLSGEFAYGYLATTSGTGATASGGGLDTSMLVFGVGEDLGGGNRVDVTMKTDGTGGRGAALNNDDQIIELTTSFAKFKAGSWKPGDWLTGVTGGATWYGLDGKILSARSFRDSVGVAIPFSKELSLSATIYEPSNLLGEGSGNAGTSAQGANVYTLTYKTGPASVSAGYVTYSNQGSTDATVKDIARVGGNYDFGVAKVGLGYQVINYAGNGTNNQTLATLSAPLGGAMSVNAAWASNKTETSAFTTTTGTQGALSGTRTGYIVGLQYNMSKRTYAILNYGSWAGATADATTKVSTFDSQNANLTALTLVHDF